MLSFAVHCIFLRTLKSKNFRQELESYAHFFEGSGHISGIFLVCFWSRSKLKDFQHVFVPSFYADETLLLVLFCFVLFYNIVLCSSWKLSSSLKSPWKLSRSLKLVSFCRSLKSNQWKSWLCRSFKSSWKVSRFLKSSWIQCDLPILLGSIEFLILQRE